MPIGANAAVLYAGTQTTVSAASTAAIANNAYSTASDALTYTHTEDTQFASAVLTMQYASGTITTGGIQLVCRLMAIDGSINEPPVAANWTGHFLGNFVTGTGMVAGTTYAIQTDVRLPVGKESQQYQFYLLNSCGVTISANWTLKITPLTTGPNT